MGKTIVEYLFGHASGNAQKMAVIVGGKETTYGRLWNLVCGYASYLKGCGLGRHDVVAVKAGQTLQFVVQYLSIHLAGGVAAPLERNLPDSGILEAARSICAKMIICDGKSIGKISEEVPEAYLLVDSGKTMEYALRGGSGWENPFPKERDLADILFTTGTTGNSKGVALSHRALVATAGNLIQGCEYKENTVLIVPGPLNHANAIRKLFTTIVNGSTIHILSSMSDLPAFYRALDSSHGRVACCLPPAAIRMLFWHSGEEIGKYADRIDFIESATAPLPEPDKLRLCRLLPHTRLYNNYGSSEAASVCMYDYNVHRGKIGCIGKVMPNAKVFIVDEQRNVICSSEQNVGYIACGGDVVMDGYVNDPVLTDEVLADGVVYTSDIGYIDEDGFVYIVGRKGDVINVGGFKVAPTEVETAALGCDGVEDCICVPVADELVGNKLKLFVVMREGVEFDEKKLFRYLLDRLERYKVPQKYEQTDKIARTYNGKLDRMAYVPVTSDGERP